MRTGSDTSGRGPCCLSTKAAERTGQSLPRLRHVSQVARRKRLRSCLCCSSIADEESSPWAPRAHNGALTTAPAEAQGNSCCRVDVQCLVPHYSVRTPSLPPGCCVLETGDISAEQAELCFSLVSRLKWPFPAGPDLPLWANPICLVISLSNLVNTAPPPSRRMSFNWLCTWICAPQSVYPANIPG